MKLRILLATVALSALVTFAWAQAQEQGGRRRNADGAQRPAQGQAQGQEGGGRRGTGGDMRDMMLNNIKEQVGADDEQWKALKPKVEKVMTLQRDQRGGMMGGMMGGRRGGGGGGAPADQPQSKTAQAQESLRTALADKSTSADDLGKKVVALREARKEARAELIAAQKDLKEGLTPRQEAALVLNGMLE